jgi:hypothetical protein
VLAEEKEEEKVIEDNATQFVNDAIAVNRVVVFSKSYCPAAIVSVPRPSSNS